jgi:hypothetical protein
MENSIDKQIKIVQTKIQVEKDPKAKQNLNTQLRKLQLRKQISVIQQRIDSLG